MTKKLTYLILTFVVCVVGNLRAQQTAVFSEYNYNPFLINSAYAGMLSSTELSATHSGFISEVTGSPRTLSLTVNSPLRDGKVGLGAGFLQDEVGVSKNSTFFAAYSYKIFFDFESNRPYWQLYQPGVLSFGITAGLQQFKEDLLSLGIMDDPNFSENINATIPTVGISFLFNHAQFFAGISAPNVLGDKLASRDDLNLSNPVYGYFGYRFFTSMFEEIMIKPNVLLKYEDGAPLQADLNIAASFKNKIEVGAGYRTSSSINLLAGVYFLKNLRFIYNYNIALKESPFGNTHGLALSYLFGDGYQID
ncbi:PorP/SprF family type IX secretion system membrane protein [Euzebyella saccharophila]|uniref:PorP/SprF family type IX secretion system membrane protein n=1 Tax=Euzebyella saccharophila TaxID=679664 RepID=A0ABV8JMY4_9FLAO|nr:PorP/SprF family type IX secretion system membrane protein [Euzebyella saccharophila]